MNMASTEPLAPIMGEVMFAAALAELLCGALVQQNPYCRQAMQEGLETMLLNWKQIAADPEHAVPETLAHARGCYGLTSLKGFKGLDGSSSQAISV